MAVVVETLRIKLRGTTYDFPLISMMDRRPAKPRRKVWALVRATEQILYGIGTSRSTGRFKAHLEACSFECLVAEPSAVEDGILTEAEYIAGVCARAPQQNQWKEK